MIRTLAAALALAALARADDLEEAGRLFRDRCAQCHAIPDRDLPCDRAWLGQVPRTA
jgi:mono/diheme cytochrome c family protein